MYTKSKSKNKYIVECMILSEFPRIVSFMVDTGATYTCCSAANIDTSFREEIFKGHEFRIFGGIVPNIGIKFYKYHAKQFTIGTVDSGERDIWITFDKMATLDLLGIDILQDIAYFHNPQKKELYFYQDLEEMQNHIKNFSL